MSMEHLEGILAKVEGERDDARARVDELEASIERMGLALAEALEARVAIDHATKACLDERDAMRLELEKVRADLEAVEDREDEDRAEFEAERVQLGRRTAGVEVELSKARANLAQMAGKLEAQRAEYLGHLEAQSAKNGTLLIRIAEVERERDALQRKIDGYIAVMAGPGVAELRDETRARLQSAYSQAQELVVEWKNPDTGYAETYVQGKARLLETLREALAGYAPHPSGTADEKLLASYKQAISSLDNIKSVLRGLDGCRVPDDPSEYGRALMEWLARSDTRHSSGTEGPLREALLSVRKHLADVWSGRESGDARMCVSIIDAALAPSPPDGTAPERPWSEMFNDDPAVAGAAIADALELAVHELPSSTWRRFDVLKLACHRLRGATRPPDGMPGEPACECVFELQDEIDSSKCSMHGPRRAAPPTVPGDAMCCRLCGGEIGGSGTTCTPGCPAHKTASQAAADAALPPAMRRLGGPTTPRRQDYDTVTTCPHGWDPATRACVVCYPAAPPTVPGEPAWRALHECIYCAAVLRDGAGACPVHTPAAASPTVPGEPPTYEQQAIARWMPAMQAKLDANADKGGWHDDSPRSLLKRVREETEELAEVLEESRRAPSWDYAGFKERVRDEAADIANMAMMVADAYGWPDAAPPTPPRAPVARDESKPPPNCAVWEVDDHWKIRVHGFLLAIEGNTEADAVRIAWECATNFDQRSAPVDEAAVEAPIPMVMHCPRCHGRHIDANEWATKPHRTHLCEHCGAKWRPAIVATVGVLRLDDAAEEG